MPKAPRGTEPISIPAATKVTESERAQLAEEYGSVYAGLRAALECLLGKDEK